MTHFAPENNEYFSSFYILSIYIFSIFYNIIWGSISITGLFPLSSVFPIFLCISSLTLQILPHLSLYILQSFSVHPSVANWNCGLLQRAPCFTSCQGHFSSIVAQQRACTRIFTLTHGVFIKYCVFSKLQIIHLRHSVASVCTGALRGITLGSV